MKAIILDGSREGEEAGERAGRALLAELGLAGWEVEHVLLREKKIGACNGDFFCWIRNPGMCHIADDNLAIAEGMMKSDLLVFLTPVTFGGYSSQLKRMVDHLIQNIAPHFTTVNGETHHEWRYEKYPDVLVMGYLDQPDPHSESIFKRLAWRNSINLCPAASDSRVFYASQSDSEMAAVARESLLSLAAGHALQPVSLPEAHAASAPAADSASSAGKQGRVALIVGSPRTKTSSSLALGQFLLEELEQNGFHTEIHFTHTSLRSPERMQSIFDAVDTADIVVFAFPLYVDSIPAPAIEVLERIADHRKTASGQRATGARFVAIANCGFPESEQNATALAICEEFARQAGLNPAGSLSLGGGEPLVRGKKLRDAHGPAGRVKKALAMAGASLSAGQAVPESAIALLAKPFIPTWLYRLVGSMGWKSQAKKYGMHRELRRRPYARA